MAKILKTEQFNKRYNKTPVDIQKAVDEALEGFSQNPEAGKYRLHTMKGLKPPIWKIDVLPNHSWQISMRREGDTYTLLSLNTHKGADKFKLL